MKSAIYIDGNHFAESEFQYEKELEKIVQENFKTLFGEKTIFFDIKSKHARCGWTKEFAEAYKNYVNFRPA